MISLQLLIVCVVHWTQELDEARCTLHHDQLLTGVCERKREGERECGEEHMTIISHPYYLHQSFSTSNLKRYHLSYSTIPDGALPIRGLCGALTVDKSHKPPTLTPHTVTQTTGVDILDTGQPYQGVVDRTNTTDPSR